MKASLPPSSITIVLRWRPATAATSRPARVLPVSVTPLTRASAMTRAACSLVRKRFCTTPAGNPASAMSFSIASAHPGVLGACLRSTTLPTISEGAAKRKNCQ